VWKLAKDAAPLLSCTIITTDAGGVLPKSTPMPLMLGTRLGRVAESAPAGSRLLAPPDVRGIELRGDLHAGQQHPNNGPSWTLPSRSPSR
jgi:hypothetical protein